MVIRLVLALFGRGSDRPLAATARSSAGPAATVHLWIWGGDRLWRGRTVYSMSVARGILQHACGILLELACKRD